MIFGEWALRMGFRKENTQFVTNSIGNYTTNLNSIKFQNEKHDNDGEK